MFFFPSIPPYLKLTIIALYFIDCAFLGLNHNQKNTQKYTIVSVRYVENPAQEIEKLSSSEPATNSPKPSLPAPPSIPITDSNAQVLGSIASESDSTNQSENESSKQIAKPATSTNTSSDSSNTNTPSKPAATPSSSKEASAASAVVKTALTAVIADEPKKIIELLAPDLQNLFNKSLVKGAMSVSGKKVSKTEILKEAEVFGETNEFAEAKVRLTLTDNSWHDFLVHLEKHDGNWCLLGTSPISP